MPSARAVRLELLPTAAQERIEAYCPTSNGLTPRRGSGRGPNGGNPA
ncbi:hypothetical protein [Thermoproteus tenax]|nr:hypothetical protein [Thermoproteus tenax]